MNSEKISEPGHCNLIKMTDKDIFQDCLLNLSDLNDLKV